ncbi:MAG: hypothetical protein AAFP84_13530 [Actinomycetota bacterium]
MRGSPSPHWWRTVLLPTVVALVAACGSGDAANSQRPLERDEANRLADALFDNFEDGGASFTYTGQVGDGSLILDGEINFVTHQGRATVSGSSAAARPIAEVVWSDAEVVERLPSLPSILADAGMPRQVEWILRPPDPEGRELDGAIALIVALASEQRDNPQLILQLPGSAFVRTQSFRDDEVEVLRYGDLTTYWLSTTTGDLLRFEGNSRDGSRPRVIDLRDRGPRTISAPPADRVITSRELGELYEVALRRD